MVGVGIRMVVGAPGQGGWEGDLGPTPAVLAICGRWTGAWTPVGGRHGWGGRQGWPHLGCGCAGHRTEVAWGPLAPLSAGGATAGDGMAGRAGVMAGCWGCGW